MEKMYREYNRREYVHPDPLEFIYNYDNPQEREIVGLIASGLAYGRVLQILKSVSKILDIMGPSPKTFVLNSTESAMRKSFGGFKHRFTTGDEMAALLAGAKVAILKHGSLEKCFLSHFSEDHETVLPAMDAMVRELTRKSGDTYLLPSPSRGSACKRLNLFMRWMVRNDDVDPGGWSQALMPKLIVPLDTHMHRISIDMGLTSRTQADLKTAVEITRAFAKISPADPVKYDFSLTRLGIIPAALS